MASSDVQEKHDSKTAESTDATNGDLESRPRFRDIRKIVIKFWLWEIAACTLGLGSLASIVGVLIYENDKLLDQWGWSIPPTAVVSFIGTLGKASIVLVLSQVLSQMKWYHFRKTESVRNVRIFDSASRGPLGAVLVIWNSKELLACITACLMVLTILIDPFVQLVFTFPSRLVENNPGQAILYRAIEFNEASDIGYGFPSQNILTGISKGFASTNITPSAVCPSGNCVWTEAIKTLGVCGLCSDVTANTKVECSSTSEETWNDEPVPIQNRTITTCNYTFFDTNTLQAHRWIETAYENGSIFFNNIRTVWNSTIINSLQEVFNPYVMPQSNKTRVELDGYQIIPTPDFIPISTVNTSDNSYTSHAAIFDSSLNFHVIQLPAVTPEEGEPNITQIPTARCWNCETYYCEKSFEAVQITNNTPSVYTISTERLWFLRGLNHDWYGFYPADINSLNGTTWKLKYRTSNDLPTYLGSLFNSYLIQDGSNSKPKIDDWDISAYLDPQQIDLFDNLEALMGLAFSEDLNVTVHGLTDSLTETFRTGSNTIGVEGKCFVNKSFIHVRWPWLALPLILMVTTWILLLLIAIKSHLDKVEIWKDDPLALLFHSVDGARILPGGDSGTGTSDLDNLSNEVYVRLDRDKPFTFIASTRRG